jgi:hypothetical protein
MVKVINLPVPASPEADEHARADTQRNQRLFDWADAVLKRLRLDKAVAGAKSLEELRRVTFNADSAEIALAIPRCAPSCEWPPPGAFSRSQRGRPQADSQEPIRRIEKKPGSAITP